MNKDYEIAKQANSIAHRILEETKDLKNDTRFGHDQNVKWEVQAITELCVQLQNLVEPIRSRI